LRRECGTLKHGAEEFRCGDGNVECGSKTRSEFGSQESIEFRGLKTADRGRKSADFRLWISKKGCLGSLNGKKLVL
jgi:hypothetical protein